MTEQKIFSMFLKQLHPFSYIRKETAQVVALCAKTPLANSKYREKN